MPAKQSLFDVVLDTSCVYWGMHESSAKVVFCGCLKDTEDTLRNTPIGENWGKHYMSSGYTLL